MTYIYRHRGLNDSGSKACQSRNIIDALLLNLIQYVRMVACSTSAVPRVLGFWRLNPVRLSLVLHRLMQPMLLC